MAVAFGTTRSITRRPPPSRSSLSISSKEFTTMCPTPLSIAKRSSASVLLLPCM